MWRSRAPASRHLEGVDVGTAVDVAREEGFEAAGVDEQQTRMKRPGTWFTLSAQKAPLNLTLSVTAPDQLELELGYGIFVLFDNGDLDREADRIAERVRTHRSPA